MRTLLLILAVTTTVAEAAPRYPLRIVTVSQAERARRKAAFEAREPIRWTEIVVNSRGFIVHLATEDPALPTTLNSVDLRPVRALLRREADSFGINPADLDDDFRSLGSCSHQLAHERNGAALGRIDVGCTLTGDHLTVTIDVIPWLDLNPLFSADDASKQVLGGHYAFTTTEWLLPPLDCNMGGTCPKPHSVTHHDIVELTMEDLDEMNSIVYRQGDTLRLVYCIDATWNKPRPGQRIRRRSDAKPLPYVFDAVTGTPLPLHPRTCAGIPTID